MIAKSESDIQRAVDEMNEMLRTSKLKSAKTKILICARDPQIKADVYIDSQKLNKVVEMLYV